MSKPKLSWISLGLVSALAVGSAFAGDRPPGSGPGRSITLDELKERCLRPEQSDVQRAPQNIKIQCSDSRLNWLAAAPGSVELNTARNVVSAVFADKFFVDASKTSVSVPSKAGSCHRFTQVEESITIERPVTCAELTGLKTTLGEFCSSALDAAKGSNPKLVEVRETGEQWDTCSAVRDHVKL